MTQYPARPSTFTQLTTTDDWERFVSCAGTWDGVDGTGSLSPGLDNVNRGVVIQPGTCMIKGQLWRCDAAVTIPYLATPSQDRIDMLVMRLTRQASTAATVVTPTLLQGPTATPAVPPALTQQATPGIWDIPVCQLTMHANGNVDTLIDVRQLVGRAVVSMFSTEGHLLQIRASAWKSTRGTSFAGTALAGITSAQRTRFSVLGTQLLASIWTSYTTRSQFP